jgi:hypothetical protein
MGPIIDDDRFRMRLLHAEEGNALIYHKDALTSSSWARFRTNFFI